MVYSAELSSTLMKTGLWIGLATVSAPTLKQGLFATASADNTKAGVFGLGETEYIIEVGLASALFVAGGLIPVFYKKE